MKEYRKTIFVNGEVVYKLLNGKIPMGEDDTVSYTAKFDDGYEVDVKICGSDDGKPWTEAVLFHNGSEVCFTEPSEYIIGEWCLETEDTSFVVNVQCEEPKL